MTELKMSSGLKQWRDGDLVTITFCVTQDCNLACSYCYMVGKNDKHVMDYETAKKIVDFVLDNKELQKTPAVAWDFIGGEPLLEMELIDKISDYIVVKMHSTDHIWKNQYRFTFSSNGTLYHKEIVRNYIKKHQGHVYFGFSVDGTKEKHDSARKKKDGTGSYDDVLRNIPLWLKEFPSASTKATFARDDLKYIKDSIIHLWDLGIKDVMANVVYEDVWQEGDDLLFEQQLIQLADYIIENNLWNSCSVAFFGDNIGIPLNEEDLRKNRCGAGYKSLAFDNEGNIYPCIRFLDMCSSSNKKLIIGHIDKGVNRDYLRALSCTTWRTVSPQICNECEVGGNCGWCIANNLEDEKSNSIYHRTTYICKMHKANVRANKYLWKRYTEVTGKTSPYTIARVHKSGNDSLRYMYIICSDKIIPHCSYKSNANGEAVISNELIKKGLKFCSDNYMLPIFLGECNHGLTKENNVYYEFVDFKNRNSAESIPIYYGKLEEIGIPKYRTDMVTLLCNKNNLSELYKIIVYLFQYHQRINLFIQDFDLWEQDELTLYEGLLEQVAEYIINAYKNSKKLQLNALNDLIHLRTSRDCGAGRSSITMAPDGNFYICPAFYFDKKCQSIGNIDEGISLNNKAQLKRTTSESCIECGVLSCNRCLYSNYSKTNEINIPTAQQCKLNYINGRISNKLRDRLVEYKEFSEMYINSTQINKFIDYLDSDIFERR